MPLPDDENIRLTSQLLDHCEKIKADTGYDPRNLRKKLLRYGANITLQSITPKNTYGLSQLMARGHSELSIEQFILESEWSEKLDPIIVAQCRTNLGRID